jgi:hypothetical protein
MRDVLRNRSRGRFKVDGAQPRRVSFVQTLYVGVAMAYHVTTRWGGDEAEPSTDRLREVLRELDADDDEHPSVSLTHESEWSLGAYPGGLLIWENLEHGEPKHMNQVPRDRILELWILLSEGRVEEIEREAWLPGYADIE